MTHTVFIDLDSHVATASATGTAAPDVPLKHLTKQTLAFAFHSSGTVSAVTGWTEGRVVVKATPTSDVLLLDTTLAATGSTTSTRYSAEWAAVDCDSAALRTLIGASVEPLDVFAEIQWTADSGTHAVAFPIQIVPAFNLPEDDPPDPTEDASWTWLKARLAAGTNVTFSDNETTNVRTIAASLTGAGSGDVTGPASSTDNALVRFDSTTGKVIQNGTVTQSDAGDLAAVNSITFDTTPTGSIAAQGQAMWNADEATVDMQLNGFVIHLGTHAVYRVKNSTGATIAKGAPVMFAGTDGNSGILLIQEWDGIGPPEYFLGPLAEELATGESGFAIMFGKLRGITTDGSDYGETWIDGDIIYASATAGNLTKTPPAAPTPLIIVCAVVHAHATNGTLFVRTTLGTVAKVAMTVPTGFSVAGSPVTSNGTLAVSYSAGYQGYTTTEADKLAAIEASADVTDAANVGSSIHGATAKTTPVDADTMPLIDSAASNVLKKLSWANIKATLKTYFDGLYQPIATILTSFSNLANAAGVLTNNGSGTLTYTGTTTGGMAGDDDGKLPKYFNSGWLMCNKLVATSTGNVSPAIEYGPTSIEFVESSGTFAGVLQWPTITASRTVTLPNVTGTVITTGNLSAITATGTIASGTWQGTIIAPAYLGTGSDITTKFLRGDGTWQAVSSGITINTTAITSGTSGRVLYNNAGTVGELATTGSGDAVRATSPTLVTPNLGAATASSLAMSFGNITQASGGQFYGTIEGNHFVNLYGRGALYFDDGDTYLISNGNRIALRNATTSQGLRIHNTWTSNTNWEAAVLDWQTTANTLRVGTDVGSGGGTSRALAIITGGTARINVGASGELGFFGATAISKPAITGAHGGNAALQSLLTALVNLGLVTDSTS